MPCRFMGKKLMENKDHSERRCPRLGGSVLFHYCENCGDDGLPCFKIFDCWWEYFDVTNYLKEKLPEDQFRKLVSAKSKPKILSLIDLIEQAKEVRNGK